MRFRVLIILLLTVGCLNTARAQNAVRGNLSADFVSSYVWRGLSLGTLSFQPELSLVWKGLEFSVWGSTGLAEPRNEIDLTVSYQIGGLKFTVNDYWDDGTGTRYFLYRPKETGHSFEGAVEYNFGPVAISWQTFFAGADYQRADGRRAFSSYFEVSVPFRLITLDWEARAGIVPWASDYYGTKGFAFQMVSLKATKAIPITERFSLPLFAELMAAPSTGRLYFVAGLTVKVF